ncbi:MAG: penicillin-binding protein 2 [Firmicutes bacterium]|nr:penicillin-binding protein 2 [Clostridiales bacterium]MBQ4340094.1 penicillin-binding protein 2 [Bacillota bacterium]
MGISIKRIKILFVGVLAVFLILCIRLFFIQIVGLERAETVYSSQYSSELHGMNYRGDILDRNGVSLVNTEETYIILLDKIKYDDEAAALLEELGAESISMDNRRYYGFKTDRHDDEILEIFKSEYGGYVFSSTDRYSLPQPAAHIIGYCNRSENTGAFGIEREYNDILVSDGKLSLTVDGVGRILPGYGLSYSSGNDGGSVQTTLDLDIQKTAEEALSKYAYNGGAAVIVDADSGGILCSASYPVFDPDNPDKAYGSSLVNKAVQTSYPPGSVFKIIVAAAAIEEGIADPEDVFICTGSENLFGVEIQCAKKEGHGEITFEEGFARSCNCVFIQLGRELGKDKLLEMANRFGVGEKVLEILEEESAGYLAGESQTLGAGIGNLSIGQGETEITCIQAAKIAGIVACYGKDPGLYLINKGDKNNKEEQIISVRTALILKKLMCSVVEEGTGRRAGKDSAGKSGSAQSYINGKKVVHGWYIGFFPTDDPKYIVSVIAEDGGGAAAAVSIFADIHEGLKNHDLD